MAAVACLRVAVDAASTGLAPAVLGPLVSKFSSAYLETRWFWPRRFTRINNYTFRLEDPHASEFDARELARLSDELQVKLFGASSEGEVALLLFEGSSDAAAQFAAFDNDELAAALRDPRRLPPGGKLSRIVSPGAEAREPEVTHAPSADQPEPAPASPEAAVAIPGPLPALEGVQGIYFTRSGVFVGDVVSSTPGRERTHYSLVEGAEHLPADPKAFDADCVVTAMRLLVEGAQAMLYLPICYSEIVRHSQRAHYQQMLSVLPPSCHKQLAAAVYDVPRAPVFNALTEVRTLLARYVTNIDLRTLDPGFEVEQLPAHLVTSVTLVLPDAEPQRRLAALRRFVERMDLYKRKQIWPGITNVRTRAELEACAAARVPFVTGPGVCRMQAAPVGGRLRALADLPLLPA